MAKPWYAFCTSSIWVPNVFTLSLMSTMAVLAYSAALTVSPPTEETSDAAKPVTCSMYWLALMPAVFHAAFALLRTLVCACSSCPHLSAQASTDCPVMAA